MKSDTPMPKLSLVVPSFNQGRFLAEALDSVLDQGYPDLELIVMDGGSDDETVEVLERYGPRLAHWQSEPDGGQSDAINRGLSLATGEVFGWLCCDDLLCGGALETVGAYFRQHAECRWLAGRGEIRYIDEGRSSVAASGLTGPDALLAFWLWGAPGHYICQPSCFWRRSLWADSGGLNVDNHLAMDYELWLAFSRLAALHETDACLSVSRIHGDCKSGGMRRQQVRQTMRSAYRAAAARGIGRARFTLGVLGGLWAMRSARLRKNLADRWFGGACREVLEMACDPIRVGFEGGRMCSVRHMWR